MRHSKRDFLFPALVKDDADIRIGGVVVQLIDEDMHGNFWGALPGVVPPW